MTSLILLAGLAAASFSTTEAKIPVSSAWKEVSPSLMDHPFWAQQPQVGNAVSSTTAAPTRVAANAAPAAMTSDPFIQNALALVQALPTDSGASAYDASSNVMKQALTRDQFIQSIQSANRSMGQVFRRDWIKVERLSIPARTDGQPAPVPAGEYVTVQILASNAQGAARLEQVSFRLDEDKVWRVTGVDLSANNGSAQR